MQRSKAAVSVEVKRVIGALCRLLAGLGLDPVPAPEAFRRAKFGGGPEEDPFWLLLSNILQRSGVIFSETSCQLRGDCRKLVSCGLWQSGYHGDWMYGADGDGVSSRDLLLALGWLLANGVLEKLLTGRVAELDRTLLSPAPVRMKTLVTMDARVQEKPDLSVEPDAASLRRLQWLMGNLRHQGRTLLSAVGARSRVLHEVLSASQDGSAAPPAGRSSAALTEDCVCLQQLCDLLEAFVSWKQVENIFWTWMNSVADRRPPGPRVRMPAWRPGTCYHGNQRLEEALMRLQEAPSRLGEASSENDGGVAALPPGSAPCLHQVCRPRLQAGSRPAEGLQGGAWAPGGLPASQAVELLLQAEGGLLQRRDGRRLATRKRLQRLMDGLEEQVFIPL